ncbi:MAG: hypothetical protein L0Y54_07155 [Sporichthyaceae bacterium]|nr:hypothetical protein [Sporichthyaceae bacterium]
MSWTIHHVQLSCPAGSQPRLRQFYAGVLGLTEIPKPAELAARGGAWFRSGSVELHLGVEAEFRPARKAHPALQLADPAELEALADRLAAAGPPVGWDGALPGYHRFHTADPVGNRIELLAPINR